MERQSTSKCNEAKHDIGFFTGSILFSFVVVPTLEILLQKNNNKKNVLVACQWGEMLALLY